MNPQLTETTDPVANMLYAQLNMTYSQCVSHLSFNFPTYLFCAFFGILIWIVIVGLVMKKRYKDIEENIPKIAPGKKVTFEQFKDTCLAFVKVVTLEWQTRRFRSLVVLATIALPNVIYLIYWVANGLERCSAYLGR